MAADVFTTRPVYMGKHGVVASGHYLAARAGQLMFDRGGNAIDAATASGYALNLLEPQNNGLGGVAVLVVDVKPYDIDHGYGNRIAGECWHRILLMQCGCVRTARRREQTIRPGYPMDRL